MPSRIPSCQHVCSCVLFMNHALDIHRMSIKFHHTSIKCSLDIQWILTKITYSQWKVNGYRSPLIFHWMLNGYAMDMHWTVMKYALDISEIFLRLSLNSNVITLTIHWIMLNNQLQESMKMLVFYRCWQHAITNSIVPTCMSLCIIHESCTRYSQNVHQNPSNIN